MRIISYKNRLITLEFVILSKNLQKISTNLQIIKKRDNLASLVTDWNKIVLKMVKNRK